MTFNEAMQILGNKLQEKYGHLGFKYKKSDKTLTRHSKNFTYMIAFSSFGGNTKDSISIEVCYIINTRPYDPYGYAKHRLTRAHREKQLKMSCQALHNAPPNRT